MINLAIIHIFFDKYREKIIDKQLYDNLINYFSRCSGHFDELGSKIKKIDDKKIDETVVKEPKIDPSKNISALEEVIKHFEDLINNDFWDAWKRRRIEDLFKYYDSKVQEVYGMIDVNDGKSAELIIRLDVLKAKLEQLHNHENIIKYQNTKIDNLRISEINKNNFSFNYGGKKSILNILDKFYLNPSIYLERKYKKVLEVYSRFGE